MTEQEIQELNATSKKVRNSLIVVFIIIFLAGLLNLLIK